MKFRDVIIIMPLAFALVACGKSSTDSAEESTVNNPNTVLSGSPLNSNPLPGPSGSSGASGTSGTSGSSGSSGTYDASGCPQYPSRSFYEYYKEGTGTGAVYTISNDIVADSKLRVSIEPGSAGGTQGTGGTANYTYLSATVHLLRNGIEVAAKSVAGPGATYWSYLNGSVASSILPTGIAVGSKSDPSKANFGSYLQTGARYSIKVDNIRTDYKCNTYCTTAAYKCLGSSSCGFYAWNQDAGNYTWYDWNWDYHQNTWSCCPTTMVNDCQKQQCGVGSILANSTWSLTVRVETDSTSCIQ